MNLYDQEIQQKSNQLKQPVNVVAEMHFTEKSGLDRLDQVMNYGMLLIPIKLFCHIHVDRSTKNRPIRLNFMIGPKPFYSQTLNI